MSDLKQFILDHFCEFEQYLSQADNLLVVILDKDLNISLHNECFRKLIASGKDCSGQEIRSFLLPESRGILPLSDGESHQSVLLNFMSLSSSPVPLYCQIFRVENDMHLILGGHLMLTNEYVLQKMTVMTNEMVNVTRDLHRKNKALEEANSKITQLSGIIPICMHCKGIRDDKGYWNRLEKFISEHSEAKFSHGLCPDCKKKYYPEVPRPDQ